MDEIFVYARVGGTKNFIGIFSDISLLQSDVLEELSNINRPNWENRTFFLLGGDEYKLFPEDDK